MPVYHLNFPYLFWSVTLQMFCQGLFTSPTSEPYISSGKYGLSFDMTGISN